MPGRYRSKSISRLNKSLDILGRILIHLGILILLFAAYQLWGTGIIEHRAQNDLQKEFKAIEAAPKKEPTKTTPTVGPPAPPTGDAVAHIVIPSIGVDKIVVQGVQLYDLKRGPGHYPNTPLPGQKGNAAIAGHRTTYGAPFFRLDEVKPGNKIFVTTKEGRFVYIVKDKKVVSPSALDVLNDFDDNRLTLTTCNPKFSASTRLVVVSKLKGRAKAASPPPKDDSKSSSAQTIPSDEGAAEGEGLSGEGAPKAPAILWGIIAAGCYVAIRVLMRKWKRWPTLIIGTPIFLVVLFVFFENASRLLPANV